MSKSFRLIMTLICFAVGVGSAISFFVAFWPKSTKPITEINQTYNGSQIKATAIDIKAFETPELKKDNQVLVIIGFEIENISSRKTFPVNSTSYEAYVNDVSASKNSLYGYSSYLSVSKLAPGKCAKGYWGINVPDGAKKLEIHVDDNSLKDSSAVFILDVPPVESITLDEYFASID